MSTTTKKTALKFANATKIFTGVKTVTVLELQLKSIPGYEITEMYFNIDGIKCQTAFFHTNQGQFKDTEGEVEINGDITTMFQDNGLDLEEKSFEEMKGKTVKLKLEHVKGIKYKAAVIA